MASIQKRLSPREDRAVGLVIDWLKDEHEYQFGSNRTVRRADPIQIREQILGSQLPKSWEQFQFYRNLARIEKKAAPRQAVAEKIVLNIGQNALKCAAEARGAYVWAAVSNGMPLAAASEKSFEGLLGFAQSLREGKSGLPWKGLLDESIQDAVTRYPNRDHEAYGKPAQTLVAVTALAIRGVLEYQRIEGDLVLPEPGMANGTIAQWQLPDPVVPN
jgi:hypothetical protein